MDTNAFRQRAPSVNEDTSKKSTLQSGTTGSTFERGPRIRRRRDRSSPYFTYAICIRKNIPSLDVSVPINAGVHEHKRGRAVKLIRFGEI